MIVVDANVLLLVLSKPTDDVNLWMHESAKRLFDRAIRGEVRLYAPTAVIAECAYVLTSKANYGLNANTAAQLLRPFLQIDQFHIELKSQILQAMDLWVAHPRLGFVDALVATLAEHPDNQLASFDKDFNRLEHLAWYDWERPVP